MLTLTKWLARSLNCRIYKGKEMAILKISSEPFQVVLKSMSSSTYTQMKNLINTVYGEIKSKSQTRRASAPPDGLAPAGPPCPRRVSVCVKASKGRVEVTGKASRARVHRGRGLLGQWKHHVPTRRAPSSSFASLQFYFSISGEEGGLKN